MTAEGFTPPRNPPPWVLWFAPEVRAGLDALEDDERRRLLRALGRVRLLDFHTLSELYQHPAGGARLIVRLPLGYRAYVRLHDPHTLLFLTFERATAP